MCRKNLNLSTSPTLPSFNLSFARILNDAYKCSGQILVNWFLKTPFLDNKDIPTVTYLDEIQI